MGLSHDDVYHCCTLACSHERERARDRESVRGGRRKRERDESRA